MGVFKFIVWASRNCAVCKAYFHYWCAWSLLPMSAVYIQFHSVLLVYFRFISKADMWIFLLRVTTQCTEPSPNVSCGEDKTSCGIKHFLWPLVANTCNQLPQLESWKIIHTLSMIEFWKVRNCLDITISSWSMTIGNGLRVSETIPWLTDWPNKDVNIIEVSGQLESWRWCL